MIRFEQLNNNATLPTRATSGSAGYDLYCSEDTTVDPVFDKYYREGSLDDVTVTRVQALIPTGIRALFPSNVVALLSARSSLFKKTGLVLSNGTGVVDHDYQLELFIPVYNLSTQSVTVKKGDKLAQIIFMPILFTSEEEEITELRQGGFGSTG